MSDFGMAVVVPMPFAAAVDRARSALADEGFGVLTEIDVTATMRAKLGVDVPAQVILGACNPPLAYRALSAQPSIALLLPCNVVVRSLGAGCTEVSAIDPRRMAAVSAEPELAEVAEEARERLAAALSSVARSAD